MTEKHEAALLDLTTQLSHLDPVCSIFVAGSIGRGECRDDSDIDLTVISWRFRELADAFDWQIEKNHVNGEGGIEVRLDSGMFRGIHLDLHCRSPRNQVDLVMSGPVYRWGGTRILYDPSGIARWGVECIGRLLADNPEYASALRTFHDQHQNWKRDKATVREFESQLEFGQSVDVAKLVRNYHSFTDIMLKDADS